MQRLLLRSIILLCLLLASQANAQEQERECTNSIDFWHELNTGTLYFINPETQERMAVAGEDVWSFVRLGFSPDCRYIGATLVRRDPNTPVACFREFRTGRSGDVTVWDATTGQLVGEYSDNHYGHTNFSWNPYGTQVVFATCDGAVLWDFADDRRLYLTEDLPAYTFFTVGWADNPHEVFVLINSGFGAGSSEEFVYSFNWGSFSSVFMYDAAHPELERQQVCRQYGFSIAEAYLFVYCEGSFIDEAPISIWDRHSHQLLYLVNGGSAGAQAEDLIDLSPDGRYLAIGFMRLRVWDLWNLPDVFEERTASYQYRLDSSGVNEIHFIDNTTVEILMDDDVTLIEMNVLTGEIHN